MLFGWSIFGCHNTSFLIIFRLSQLFRDKTAYLDIETNGISIENCLITSIALYGGGKIYTYVQGRNLQDFKRDIDQFEVIVTYNGKSFDIPLLEKFLGRKIRQAHIDLRHILGNLGFKGGLKGCEKQMGINRMELDGVDGYFAVLLWNEYKKTGNNRALETLLAYNIADTVNLEILMVHAYNLNLADTPFKTELHIPLPRLTESPFHPDPIIIKRLKGKIAAGFRDRR